MAFAAARWQGARCRTGRQLRPGSFAAESMGASALVLLCPALSDSAAESVAPPCLALSFQMASPPTKQSLLHLYHSMLRTSQSFSSYNFRHYFVRRTKSTFREIQVHKLDLAACISR